MPPQVSSHGSCCKGMSPYLYATSKSITLVQQELRYIAPILHTLCHENVVPFYGYCVLGFPAAVMPFYENGNILEYLERVPNANRLSMVRIFSLLPSPNFHVVVG